VRTAIRNGIVSPLPVLMSVVPMEKRDVIPESCMVGYVRWGL